MKNMMQQWQSQDACIFLLQHGSDDIVVKVESKEGWAAIITFSNFMARNLGALILEQLLMNHAVNSLQRGV